MVRLETTITLQPQYSVAEMETKLGTYMDVEEDWLIVRGGPGSDPMRIVRDDGTLIAVVCRSDISNDLTNLAVDCYLRVGKMVSSNRGQAAGLADRGRSHTTYDKGRAVNSGIMGYIDNTNLRRPCRLTQFSRDHFEQYSRGLPFIKRINECFRDAIPDAYERQLAEAQKTEFRIEDTAFSTVTVNYNYRTSLHKDSGDFREGFGNLVVCQKGITGGLLLFPRYKLAIVPENGDFIGMDVHEYHCNSPITIGDDGGYRLSFVCYLRERMSQCSRINDLIKRMSGSRDDWIRYIFEAFDGPNDIPPKVVTGHGNAGHEWWERRGVNVTLVYKHKRYTLIDHVANKTIHELANAWEYAKHTINSRHQSQEDDGSYQAQ